MITKQYDYDKVDFNQDITRKQINQEIYDSKFIFVDKILALKNPHPKYWKTINEDLTMKSYAFLRLNGEPLRLYPYQDLIINDSHRFKYFRSANQTGKSLFLDVDAIMGFIEDHGHAFNAAIVSKSLPQSTFQMRRIKGLLNAMKLRWKEDKGSTDSMSVITIDFKDPTTKKLKYSNMIICAPCTEGLLGYDLHKLYLDEFEFWEVDLKYFFNQIAQPRTYHTKGDIIITTNPNGEDNFGAELEKQTLTNGDKKWHVYVFNYLDKPGNTEEEYKQLKNELSRTEFESTVAAIRSTSDRNYLTPDEVERSLDKTLNETKMVGEQPFFFLDVGATHDQSCLVGGYITLSLEYDSSKDEKYNKAHIHVNIPIIHLYPRGYPLSRVVGSYDESQDSDGWHVEKSVKDYLEEWTIEGVEPLFGCDVTGNSGMNPLFQTNNINPVDVTFSGPVKSAMYQRLKYVMEKGLLHRIKHKDWDWQARHLVATKSARGYLLINSPGSNPSKKKIGEAGNKRTPDDCMDATVGLMHLMDNPDHVPVTMEVF